MGLAERFKTKLETKNIFEKDIIEQKLEEKDIKFISKPVTGGGIEAKNGIIQQPVIIENSCDITNETLTPPGEISSEPVCGSLSGVSSEVSVNIFEDLETELISKIRQTPYWEEFSTRRQTCMIENYFNSKIKTEKYCGLKHSQEDKENFINTALILANNR